MVAVSADSSAFSGSVSEGYRRYALGVLMVILTLNFVDRHVMNILAERIKHDLHLSDGQLGVLTGLGFALLYSVCGLPIARLAERFNRVKILAVCLAVWSAFTALGGFALGYMTLAMSRVGVGVGEAGCNPSAQSLIVDYVKKENRSSAMAFYYVGAPLGVLLGMTAGGLISDWRQALVIVGAPGLAVAMLAALTLREPRMAAPTPANETHPTFLEGLQELSTKRSFWFAMCGSSLITFVAVGHTAFTASFFMRNHGPELAALAAQYGLTAHGFLGPALGIIQGVAGIVGVFAGGFIGDKLGAKDIRWLVLLPAMTGLFVAPLYTWAMLDPSAVKALWLLAPPSFFHNMYFGPMLGVIMGLVHPRNRATTAAVYGIAVSLVGIGFGPYGLGLLSDYLNHNAGLGEALGLRWAMIWSNLVILIAAVFFWLASRTVREEQVS